MGQLATCLSHRYYEKVKLYDLYIPSSPKMLQFITYGYNILEKY